MTTIFRMVKLTGITVNIKNGEIKLSATVKLDDENFEKAESLRPYLEAETGGVTVQIEPMQTTFNKT